MMTRRSSVAPADRFPASASKSLFPYLFAAAFAVSVLYSLRAAQVDPRLLFAGDALANVVKFLRGAFPPQISRDFLSLMARPALETVQISVMGMAIAIVIAVPLGLLATSSLGWRVVLHGLLPQALPNVVGYTLYRWECAIRASAVLGFVGAGGLGQQIELSMRMFQFDEVLTLLGMLFLLVATVDVISGRIRARIA